MSSERRIASSRANGAKSHGPKTPEGKAASAQNATRHGITARSIPLTTEGREEFQSLFDAFLRRFVPQDAYEFRLVRDLAIVQWRLNRVCEMESACIDHEIAAQEEQIRREYVDIDDATRTMLAFTTADRKTRDLARFSIYEMRLRRAARQTLRDLAFVRERESLNTPPAGPMFVPDGPAASDQDGFPRNPAPAAAPEPAAAQAPETAPEPAPEATELAESTNPTAETTKRKNEPNPNSGHPAVATGSEPSEHRQTPESDLAGSPLDLGCPITLPRWR